MRVTCMVTCQAMFTMFTMFTMVHSVYKTSSSEQAQFFFTTIRSNIWLTAAQLSPSFPLSISLISSTTVPSETASPFLLH
jgi:hypothetical protein